MENDWTIKVHYSSAFRSSGSFEIYSECRNAILFETKRTFDRGRISENESKFDSPDVGANICATGVCFFHESRLHLF
jgi:hypothetical protein